MAFTLKDTAPTTAEELAVYSALEADVRTVWCPIREHQLSAVVCSRLQADRRRRCRARRCKNLDAPFAKLLKKARKAARQTGSPQQCSINYESRG
jgi:hypothetical protein